MLQGSEEKKYERYQTSLPQQKKRVQFDIQESERVESQIPDDFQIMSSGEDSESSGNSEYKRESIFYKEHQEQKAVKMLTEGYDTLQKQKIDDGFDEDDLEEDAIQFFDILDNIKNESRNETRPNQGQQEMSKQQLKSEITRISYANLGFDIDKALEQQAQADIEERYPSQGQNEKMQEEQQEVNVNILEMIEKNEKMNESLPEKSLEQANQVLSFDNNFYNVKRNKLMHYLNYPAIARKVHNMDHKLTGEVQCIQMLKNFLFIGNSNGIIRVFDLKTEKEMKPLMDEKHFSNCAVKCIHVNSDHGFLMVGYQGGHLGLWNLNQYKLIKCLPKVHQTDITQVNLYSVSTNGNNICGVSCEDYGAVKLFELNKKALVKGFNFSSEYLFKNKMQGCTQIAAFVPSDRYPNLYCEENKLVAFGGTNIITICSMTPIACIHTISKPKFIRDVCLPYIDWGFGLTPSYRNKTVSIMAFAWDRIIQLLYINDEAMSLEVDGFYYSEKSIVALYFVGDSILYALFETRGVREAKILYTTNFYPGSYKQLEKHNIDDMHDSEFEKVASITMHAELEKTHDTQQVCSQEMNRFEIYNYTNCVQKYTQNILFLGENTIQIGRQFSWEEYIDHIKFEEGYDWLAILKVALEIYNGDLKGYSFVPDDKEVREAQLQPYMKELIKQTIGDQIWKSQLRKQESEHTYDQSSDTHAKTIVIKVAIDFCLNIGITEFLFQDIFQLFCEYTLKDNFIQNMEPFIISGQFQNYHIPEDILSKFIELYECKIDYALQLRKLERIIQKLDVQNYSSDLKFKLEVLCQEQSMISGLLYLQGFQNGVNQGDGHILQTMYKIMKKVSSKEKKVQIQSVGNSYQIYQKKDIQMINMVDKQKKYDIEKSKCYIGYKLLWIIKLYLEGRQFPYGSLSQQKWQRHSLRISTLVMQDEFLKEFLEFDSVEFFNVIQKLFYDEPYYFLKQDRVLEQNGGPLTIINKLSKVVAELDNEKKQKKLVNLQSQMGKHVSHVQKQYTIETIKQTFIMSQFQRFIMKIHFLHSEYQKNYLMSSTHQEVSENSNFKIKMMAPPALKIDEDLILSCIKKFLKNHFLDSKDTRKKKTHQLDEQMILDSIKLCKTLGKKEIENLLKLIDDENLQEYLIYLRIYLFEQQSNYIDSFKLNMSEQVLRENIFTWIDDKFSRLVYTMQTDDRLQNLKDLVEQYIEQIIEIDAFKTIDLIDLWYNPNYFDQLIRKELSQNPHIQYKFLKEYMRVYEQIIKMVIEKQHAIGDQKEKSDRYMSYIKLFVKLLCQLQDESKGQVTQQLLETYVNLSYYPIEDCLSICEYYHQNRAIATLYERQKNFQGAIDSYMSHLRLIPIVQIGLELLTIVQDAHFAQMKKLITNVNMRELPSIDKIIELYSSQWDYGQCTKQYLIDFDTTVQKACDLSNKIISKDQNNYNKVQLEQPTSSDIRDDEHHASNAIDGTKDTYFAVKGGILGGYWQSNFTVPGTHVTRVEVTAAKYNEDEANNAKVYVGDKLVGILPSPVEKSKVYTYDCDAVGEYITIVSGRKDMKLAFANVDVYANDEYDKTWFQILQYLDKAASKCAIVYLSEKSKHQKIFKLISQLKIYSSDIEKTIIGLVNDFIIKRKNYIMLKEVPGNISPQKLINVLHLDMRAIRMIYIYQIDEIKKEENIVDIANSLGKKEIFIATDQAIYLASHGYLLNTDKIDYRRYGILNTNIMEDEEQCVICNNKLVSKYSISQMKIFVKCCHTFHNHCINTQMKETKQPQVIQKSNAQCPKCEKENNVIQEFSKHLQEAKEQRRLSHAAVVNPRSRGNSMDVQSPAVVNNDSDEEGDYISFDDNTQVEKCSKSLQMEYKLAQFDIGLNDYQSMQFNQ